MQEVRAENTASSRKACMRVSVRTCRRPVPRRWEEQSLLPATAPCVALLLRKGLFACRFSPLRLINIASFSRRIISAVSKDSQFAEWAGDLVAEASQAAEQEHKSVLVKQPGDRFCSKKVCSEDRNSNLLVKKIIISSQIQFPQRVSSSMSFLFII